VHHSRSRGGSGRRVAVARALVATAFVALLAGCSSAVSGGDTLGASPVLAKDLALIGEFELMTPNASTIDSAAALEAGRAQDFGRPGAPEASLVRTLSDSPGYPAIWQDRLVWVFHWGSLGERYEKGFPGRGPDATPWATAWIMEDYFLVVDATTGEPLFGLLE